VEYDCLHRGLAEIGRISFCNLRRSSDASISARSAAVNIGSLGLCLMAGMNISPTCRTYAALVSGAWLSCAGAIEGIFVWEPIQSSFTGCLGYGRVERPTAPRPFIL
jgi:hypothetical protein